MTLHNLGDKMNYAKVKFNESLVDYFQGSNFTKNYKDEISEVLKDDTYFEKNIYTVLKYLESTNAVITGISDYSEFKKMCIENIIGYVQFDLLYAIEAENMMTLVEDELKLDVDELKTALLLEHFGEESKTMLGFDIDKVNHILSVYDLDNDGVIIENEFRLSDMRIDYDTFEWKELDSRSQKIEYSDMEL